MSAVSPTRRVTGSATALARRLSLGLCGAAALALAGTTVVYAGGDAEAGKKKSVVCEACHGKDGNGTAPQNPRLAGQHASYLEEALRSYATGERKNAIMAGFAKPLSAQDRADLAAYYSKMTGLVTPKTDR